MNQSAKGFTLVELCLVTALSSGLVLTLATFFQAQLALSKTIHQKVIARHHFNAGFAVIHAGLTHVASIPGMGQISVSDRLELEYYADEQTTNCLGTQALSGTVVRDVYYLVGHHLLCESQYQDVNQHDRLDHQPIASGIASVDFSLQVLHDCMQQINVRFTSAESVLSPELRQWYLNLCYETI